MDTITGTELQIGQTLYTRNGDKVVLTAVSGHALTVTSNSREYVRGIDDVGKTLFTANPLAQAAAEIYEGDEAFHLEARHLKETQERLTTFSGFVLAIDIGLFGNVIGTQIGFDDVTKEALIQSPYFARMDIEITEHGDSALEVAYIGKKGVYHEDRLLISDWRSEIGQKYYMKNITKFIHNGFDYELMLRRALRIRNSTLTGYENEFAKAAYIRGQSETAADMQAERVTDPFLQEIIRQKHYQNKLTDIIESIQENQNTIITCDEDLNLVVQGCAGSGKTMILLHRLSFIKYRNKSLDLSKIKILTPNSLFSMYINDLSTSLELEKIDRLTVNEYYAELLSRYYSIERLQLKNRCAPGELEAFKASLLVREKASAGCPEVYSEAYWDIIKDEAARAMSDILGNKLRIAELNSILKEKTPYGVDADTRSIKNIAELRLILDHIKAEFEPYYRQLKIRIESEAALASAEDEFLKLKAALPNAEALLDRLTRETAAKETNLRLTYEQRKTMLSVQLKQLKAELKRTSQEPRRKQLMHGISHVLSDLYEFDFCLCALKYERLKHVLDIDRKKLQEESDRLPFTDDDMVLIENAYAFTESFSVAMLEKSVLEAVKARCGAALSFRNQIYIRLLTRYFLQGPLTNAEKLLCIDEGHDLCANEYRLLAAVCGNGLRFNIYGDVNQLIGEGISDWLELKNTFDFTLFTLNENYRNSAEIIEYCNGTLGFDTTNLGVGGDPVSHLDMDGFVRHANNAIIGTRKVAVLAKQKTPSLLALLRERLLDKVNTGEINAGEIAVLTPREAKGLEFDTCYVMTKGMSRNEKYIAFTRALNELYIIDPKFKADK